ncbi:MAG: protein-disulfide reductase DsbD [Gammaproteobacteria bacterium]|nr:MAG: protein-disulfide reductase DsbD [Gammaproteobacteria bacterium]
MIKRLFAALFLMPLLAVAATEEELLEPDKAFALTMRVVDAHTLEASWKIAPGYYLYRDKFRFESLDSAIALKPAVLPAGKVKEDQFFGKTEIYIKDVSARLPLAQRPEGAGEARIKITAQGCNEPIGVCYPPITKEIRFKLPALVAKAAAAEPKTGQIASLKDLAKAVEPTANGEPVDPAKAFRVDVATAGNDVLLARFIIDDCCYLYRDKVTFALARRDGGAVDIKLGSYTLPPGKAKTDEFLGKTEVYYNGFEVRLPVSGVRGARGDYQLKVGYQGCSEKGVTICYPPTTQTLALAVADDKLFVGRADTATAPEAPKRSRENLLLAVAAAFGVGLLLTFTPCVLPMIPILSSVIVGSSDRHVTKLEGGLMSGAYVLGTAVTYTVAGVLAGATGEQLQAYFQHPAALVIFSAILGFLALSMFGFYELHLPAFLQTALHKRSADIHLKTKHTKVGALFGVFAMGLVAALIVGACVSPLLISALGVAIANRDPVLGGAIMFSMALGMGVILIAIGVGAGFLLPKAGAWMQKVKDVFGVLLLAVAIYMLGLIPQVPVLLLWATLLIVTGVYLGATQSLPAGTSGWQYLWKGFGTVLLVWGVLALLGGFAGNRDVMNPLPLSSLGGATVAAPAPAEHLFTRVKTLAELDSRLAAAKTAGKPVMLDYYADWCTDCVRMEKATFAQSAVRAEMQGRFVLLQADVTDPNDAEVKAMKQRLGVFGPPAMLFFGSDGAERRDLRAYGFRAPEEFLGMLRQVR